MNSISEVPNNLRIRKLEPWIVATHIRLAEHEGVSTEEYLRRLLKNQALKAQVKFADKMQVRRAEIAEKFGTNFTPSQEIIRSVRDEDS